MQTHRDDEHLTGVMAEIFAKRQAGFELLKMEGERLTSEGGNTITADGRPVREWEAYGVTVRELPERAVDESLNIVRISLGGSVTEGMAYCVFRGSTAQAKDVLRRALNALNKAP